jgi:hypothetical protein
MMARVCPRFRAIFSHIPEIQPHYAFASSYLSLRNLASDSSLPHGGEIDTNRATADAGLEDAQLDAGRADAQLDQKSQQPYAITDKRLESCDVTTESLLVRHQASLPFGPKQYLFNLAKSSGAQLIGDAYHYFEHEMRTRAYPELQNHERLYPPGVLEDTQMELLRRHNMSMPCKKNQRIYGTVYATAKQRVWVDIGYTTLSIVHLKVRCLTRRMLHRLGMLLKQNH